MADRPLEFSLDYGHPLAQGLQFAGLGRIVGSTRYEDSSLWPRHGALTNMPATAWRWIPELGRWALDFDPAAPTDRVQLGVTAYAMGIRRAATFTGWAKFDNLGGARTVMSDYAGGNGMTLRANSATSLTCYLYRANNPNSLVATVSTMSPVAWYHITGVFTGTQIMMYLDGASAGTPVSITQDIGASSEIMAIGERGSSGGNPMDGMIADPMIWDYALPDSWIRALADRGNAMLSGLIRPRRIYWGAVVAGAPPSGNRRRRLLLAC